MTTTDQSGNRDSLKVSNDVAGKFEKATAYKLTDDDIERSRLLIGHDLGCAMRSCTASLAPMPSATGRAAWATRTRCTPMMTTRRSTRPRSRSARANVGGMMSPKAMNCSRW